MERDGAGGATPLNVHEHASSTESGLPPRVAVRDLSRRFGSVVAVDAVSLEIGAGEIFGLLGPNGAGKTTTLESIVGLTVPDSGTIEICGIDLCTAPDTAKHKLGAVLQANGFQDGITPHEAIEAHAALFGVSPDIRALLDRFGLSTKARARVATLSGGQKQRLTLAMALVNDPAVLVLDEPTVGLDAQMRREFHDDLRAMRNEGRSVLLATHDMDEATQLCDRLAIINGGRIVASGTPAALIASLRSAMRVKVVADKAIESAWLDATDNFADVNCTGAELSFTTQNLSNALTTLLNTLTAHEIKIVSLDAGKGTLADVILDVMAARSRT